LGELIRSLQGRLNAAEARAEKAEAALRNSTNEPTQASAPTDKSEWVLVPRDLTPAMLTAIRESADVNGYRSRGGRLLYRAMLAASPSAPTQSASALTDPRYKIVEDAVAKLPAPAPTQAASESPPISEGYIDEEWGDLPTPAQAEAEPYMTHAECLRACNEASNEKLRARITAPTQAGPSAYCRACQFSGMSNCAHFDECGQPQCVKCHQNLDATKALTAASQREAALRTALEEAQAKIRDCGDVIRWLVRGVDFERSAPNGMRPTIRAALATNPGERP
jgi:hypothetical protein